VGWGEVFFFLMAILGMPIYVRLGIENTSSAVCWPTLISDGLNKRIRLKIKIDSEAIHSIHSIN